MLFSQRLDKTRKKVFTIMIIANFHSSRNKYLGAPVWHLFLVSVLYITHSHTAFSVLLLWLLCIIGTALKMHSQDKHRKLTGQITQNSLANIWWAREECSLWMIYCLDVIYAWDHRTSCSLAEGQYWWQVHRTLCNVLKSARSVRLRWKCQALPRSLARSDISGVALQAHIFLSS